MTRMTTATRKATMVLSALGAMAMLALPASAQSSCKWYGATALKQQQRNEQMGCNFAGPEWHTDLGRHMAWCGRVPPDVWKASAQKRDQMLAQCAKK